jgi:hypothetical protein
MCGAAVPSMTPLFSPGSSRVWNAGIGVERVDWHGLTWFDNWWIAASINMNERFRVFRQTD